jgi:hypothetical protein
MIIGGGWDQMTTLPELTDDELLVVAKMLTERETPEPIWDAIQAELTRRVGLAAHGRQTLRLVAPERQRLGHS